MANKKYRIHLSDSERAYLIDLIDKRSPKSYQAKRANILLAIDESSARGGVSDGVAARDFRTTVVTIERLRKRLCEEGLEVAINGKPREFRPVKVDGAVEAHLIALRCQTDGPEGAKGWSLRLLADEMVELNYVDSISHEKVRQVLKKTS
jgi:transposase